MFRGLRKTAADGEIGFYEPYLQFSYWARVIVRLVFNICLIIQVAATVVLLVSDIRWLFWIGVMSAIYLLDRVLHYNRPDYYLPGPGGEIGNAALYLTPRAKKSVISAYDKSVLIGGDLSVNAAKVLLEAPRVQEILARLEVDKDEFNGRINDYLAKHSTPKTGRKKLREEAERLVVAAVNSRDASQRQIDNPDLFAALGRVGEESTSSLFSFFEINADDLERAVIFSRLRGGNLLVGRVPKDVVRIVFPYRRVKHHVMNRAWTARPTPTLDRFSTDITDLARMGQVGFLVGHNDAYNRLVDILSRSAKPNAILIGESGVGKRAIVEHLALMIAKDQVPRALFDKRLVSLDIGGIVAGADQAKLQERLRVIFDEIGRAGNVVLFIPDIHNLSRTAGEGRMTAAQNILPLITSNDFPTVGATLPREFRRLIEPDSLFKEAFETVQVNEVTDSEAERILVYKSVLLERKYRVTIAYAAIKASVSLARKYLGDKPLPASADDLLRETVSYVGNKGDKVVNKNDVVSVAEARVRVPIHAVEEGEAENLLHMEDLIHRRLVDQGEAVKVVAGALRSYRSGLTKEGGPIGAFLFIGPTGVGKTELAKSLAEIQFGDENVMTRFDMSEYQSTDSVYRFIGSPDGKISGALTDAIRERPYSLVLLDEFEKAHPDIMKLFLQVFGDGRLTDNIGRTVSFENTIIIATSNAEAVFIKESLDSGHTSSDIRDEVIKRLTKYFAPELLNRFSAVVMFRGLRREDIEEIARIHLVKLQKQLKKARGVDMVVSGGAIERIAELGYDPSFGARPLERVISEKLRGPLSEKILAGDVKRGMSLRVDVNNEGELEIYEKR